MSIESKTLPHTESTAVSRPHWGQALARRALLARLEQLREGQIEWVEGERVLRFGRPTNDCPLVARLEVRDARFYTDLALGGSMAAAEAYMAGHWRSDDLTALLRIMARNMEVADGMDRGPAALAVPLQRLSHWLNRNTEAGSRRNIAAHYDLGNDFFRLMLDETMMYSSAIFAHDGMSLYQAQRHRLEVICQKLKLQASDHLLEIGTGWGGLALYAAEHYGCRVTTTTISREQYELARRRVAEAGLEDRITVLMEDYRRLTGQFDKLVSIEMIEAIGHEYYATYFRRCAALLKPNGLMLIQAITIADQRYEQAKQSVDFIKRYIFPGGCLPSVTVMTRIIGTYTDLRLTQLEDIGPHYATTLSHWRDNVQQHLGEIRALGYSDVFLRMWHYYLCYCEAGFRERTISAVHLVAARPGV